MRSLMLQLSRQQHRHYHLTRRGLATATSPTKISIPEQIQCDGIQSIDISQFRALMKQERPFSMKDVAQRSHEYIPAIKWFKSPDQGRLDFWSMSWAPDMRSMNFTYELMLPSASDVAARTRIEAFKKDLLVKEMGISSAFCEAILPMRADMARTDGATFHSFMAPGSLLEVASRRAADDRCHLPSLYMAQTQLIDLPLAMRAELPTPHLVLEADKGDVYDANLWIGTPPTYTPLHKDPNPNLFVQLGGRKVIRAFSPKIGRSIFDAVQREVLVGGREGGHASFRGEEMMHGQDRAVSDDLVWKGCAYQGFEVVVEPGDAMYIPKGWWHSIKSIGDDLNASVNWWFR